VASPFVHLLVADRVATALAGGDAHLPPHLPLVLAGSIAPDADKLGLCPRSASHFIELGAPGSDVDADISGAVTLLQAHPELAAARLPSAARAFVAGYLCHLIADEQWLLTIYRPFFGRASAFGDTRAAVQLHWALHLLRDARLAGDARLRQLIERVRTAPLDRLPPRLLPFLPRAAIATFCREVLAQDALPPGYARAAFVVTGRERTTGVPRTAAEVAAHDAFLASLPALMARAAEVVPAAALAEFDRRATDESVALLGDYLAGRPLRPPTGPAPHPRTGPPG
jgi:hypothetical protein